MVPYLEGERTPNLPDATGAVHGLTLANATAANLARAAVEGMLCGIAAGLDALIGQGVSVSGIRLVGGAARSEAVRRIAPSIFAVPVSVPPPGEYVADGAARQAAWVLVGTAEPPDWPIGDLELCRAEPAPGLRERYAEAAGKFLSRTAGSASAGEGLPLRDGGSASDVGGLPLRAAGSGSDVGGLPLREGR